MTAVQLELALILKLRLLPARCMCSGTVSDVGRWRGCGTRTALGQVSDSVRGVTALCCRQIAVRRAARIVVVFEAKVRASDEAVVARSAVCGYRDMVEHQHAPA
jgi:hypothetical protein